VSRAYSSYPATTLASWIVLAVSLIGTPSGLAQEGTLRGRTVNRSQSGEILAVPGATVTLASVAETPGQGAAPEPVESDLQGSFRFAGVAEGCYLLTAETSGLRGQSDIFCIPLAEGQRVQVEMGPKVFVESVDVTATAIAIDTAETTSRGSVGVATLYDAPKLNKRYDDVMPLIPGVYRGPTDEVNINGSRPTESGSQFNGVDITDPVNGNSPFSVPLDTMSNVQVLSNPYDAQYGGFSGAVSTVETKPADMSDWKVALQDFVPRLRRRDGSIVGIEAIAPRFTLTGPIKKGKIAFLHSTEYHFIRVPQDDANLDPLKRDTERESFTTFNQFDIRHTPRNSSSIGVLIYPAKVNFFGLNAFNTQESTADLRRRSYLINYQNRQDFESGASLLSQFSYQNMDKDVKPLGYDPYVRGLERAEGSFFNREERGTKRFEVSERYNFRPLEKRGMHLLQTGFEFAHQSYDGTQTFNPITWLGMEDRPVLRAEFGPPAALKASKQDYGGYLQDKWTAAPALTLDLGLRIEGDSIASRVNPSLRAGFAYSIGKGARTVLRGGAGLFYGRNTLVVPVFPNMPARTEQSYGPSTEAVSVRRFQNRFGGPLRNPKTLGWNLQLDREITPRLFGRVGYQQRHTRRNFVVEREEDVWEPRFNEFRNYLTLGNTGRDTYREWQFTLRHVLPDNGHVSGSYVRSSAVGDLNDLGSIYGATPAELILPNQRGPLSFDSPNRVIVWAELGLPLKLRAIPVVEFREGFPYSEFDEFRDYAGAANRAGRFRYYKSFDMQVTRVITFRVRGKQRRVRIGLRLFNLLNTFNPKDVQSNTASPYFGTFYRGDKRRVRILFGLAN